MYKYHGRFPGADLDFVAHVVARLIVAFDFDEVHDVPRVVRGSGVRRHLVARHDRPERDGGDRLTRTPHRAVVPRRGLEGVRLPFFSSLKTPSPSQLSMLSTAESRPSRRPLPSPASPSGGNRLGEPAPVRCIHGWWRLAIAKIRNRELDWIELLPSRHRVLAFRPIGRRVRYTPTFYTLVGNVAGFLFTAPPSSSCVKLHHRELRE